MSAKALINPQVVSPSEEITFRPGVVGDSYTLFDIFEQALADLLQRLGSPATPSISSPETLARMWQERRPLYEHLAKTAAQFWVAEQNGREIGFSRSVLRDGVQQLTELFVLPGIQSKGVGRALIELALPAIESSARTIIATADARAQALYFKAGVYPRFPIYYFGRRPEKRRVDTDLSFVPVSLTTPGILDVLGLLDKRTLEHRRDVDHIWLLRERQGFLYYRGGQPVGYGYLGRRNGPFALLEAADFPSVLAHGETWVAGQGYDEFGVEVPTINETAVDTLLARGFQMDSFLAILMSDKSFGAFDKYIFPSPPFFM